MSEQRETLKQFLMELLGGGPLAGCFVFRTSKEIDAGRYDDVMADLTTELRGHLFSPLPSIFIGDFIVFDVVDRRGRSRNVRRKVNGFWLGLPTVRYGSPSFIVSPRYIHAVEQQPRLPSQ